MTDYKTARAAEKRAACTACGTSDADCTDGIFGRLRSSCCDHCRVRDTHPPAEALKAPRPWYAKRSVIHAPTHLLTAIERQGWADGYNAAVLAFEADLKFNLDREHGR
jgi:hypothetical protein